MANDKYFFGLGRRKSSTARARILKGTGKIKINDLAASEYLSGSEKLLWSIERPLTEVDLQGKYDITIVVSGGGHTSQVGACQLAIANALSDMNEDLRSTLKRAGFLKRDPREKERKKYGLKRARKKEQFSKR